MSDKLISADKLKAIVKQEPTDGMYTHEIISLIDEAPAVDAVEVVRCRNCFRGDQYDDGSDNYVCSLGGTRKGSDFCSDGERREGNE